ncbi:MAG: hypothetical protein ACRENP_28215 [Longimicrobiales bacterium]
MTHARSLLTTGFLLAIVAAATSQETKPNLTGRWQLDPAATVVAGGGRGAGNASGGGNRSGGGIGLGPPATELQIEQTDSTLRLDVARADGNSSVILYRLNGKTAKNQIPIGRGGTAEATYSSRWNGAQLATSITRTTVTRGNATNVRYRELLYLTSDSILVMETTVSGAGGRTALYRRAK